LVLPHYGIVPRNSATLISLVMLPVTFRIKDNCRTEYIMFEVVNIESSYHGIQGRLALA
jgi:hypothetical protein